MWLDKWGHHFCRKRYLSHLSFCNVSPINAISSVFPSVLYQEPLIGHGPCIFQILTDIQMCPLPMATVYSYCHPTALTCYIHLIDWITDHFRKLLIWSAQRICVYWSCHNIFTRTNMTPPERLYEKSER